MCHDKKRINHRYSLHRFIACCIHCSGLHGETLMLRFIDLNQVKHAIDITKVTNVAIRPQDKDWVCSFHFGGSHIAVAIVDQKTADQLHYDLGIKNEH